MPISEYVDIQKVNSQINEVILSKKSNQGFYVFVFNLYTLNEWLSNMKFKKHTLILSKFELHIYFKIMDKLTLKEWVEPTIEELGSAKELIKEEKFSGFDDGVVFQGNPIGQSS